MVAEDGTPNVLEFNCRFGDPETQPIMMRLKSDLVELCLAATNDQLEGHIAEWDPQPAVGVVLASTGYPESYKKGDLISGLGNDSDGAGTNTDIKVFHAGTIDKDADILTAGGRVLCVTALGNSVKDAQQKAYNRVDEIHWSGMFYRKDIGYKAINRGT